MLISFSSQDAGCTFIAVLRNTPFYLQYLVPYTLLSSKMCAKATEMTLILGENLRLTIAHD
jgi:hypothetical protein